MVLGVWVVVAFVAATGATRVTVPFGYGWRFHFGDVPGGGPGPGSCSFEKDISGYDCEGLIPNPNRFTPGDCETACCYNPRCHYWQQSAGGRQCYHAETATCKPGNVKRTGGYRAKVNPFRRQYPFAEAGYGDDSWQVVDAPHDFAINNSFVDMPGDNHHGYLPRNVSWYRKHFHLPSNWEGNTVWIYFEGVFHYTEIWVNGHYLMDHSAGYTGFSVRLDNITGLQWGSGQSNVIALRVDASYGSGHWYEGGGIYRPVHIVSVPPVHIPVDGLYVPAEGDGTIVKVAVELENLGTVSSGIISVNFTLGDGLAANSTTVTLAPNGNHIVQLSAIPKTPLHIWTVQQPTLYPVTVTVSHGSTVLDTQYCRVGYRSTRWDGSKGFFLNQRHLKFRGFSHHNSFGGIGVAIPDRVNLFRVQSSRALGSNIWRMSHNPYVPALYDFLDTLGVLVWDENRDYGVEYTNEMHDMVKRDRNHPSIVVWGFCNEYECLKPTNATGLAFRKATLAVDQSRATAANGNTWGIDVQGHSHSGNSTFIKFHQENPKVPQVLSECCSCTSQRPDRRFTHCIPDQNSPGLLPFVTGSLGVWTLMDYYGEQHSWPNVGCSYGQFDLAGFPKTHAYWYRSNWLALFPQGNAGRPPLPALHVARILDLWGAVPWSPKTTIATVVTTTQAELYLDGKSQGKMPSTPGTMTEWTVSGGKGVCTFPKNLNDVQCHGLKHYTQATTTAACQEACCDDGSCMLWQFMDGKGCWGGATEKNCVSSKGWVGAGNKHTSAPNVNNLTVVALEGSNVVASHSIVKPGQPKKLHLTIDVPSPSTGTGHSLVANGGDAALLRASLVDDHGVLVSTEAVNVTFRVTGGMGRVIGVQSGDPANHQLVKDHEMLTYGGMARGVVQVTEDCMTPHRDISLQIDVDANRRTKVDPGSCSPTPITVEISAKGYPSATVQIPVSADPHDSPASVAASTVDLKTYTYLEEYDG